MVLLAAFGKPNAGAVVADDAGAPKLSAPLVAAPNAGAVLPGV